MPELHNCGEDAAAYALGALEPAEAEAFRKHLETCAVCRAEVESFGAVVDVLPMSVAQYRAPARLRKRVHAEIKTNPARQQAPGRTSLRVRRPVLAGLVALAVGCAALLGVELSPGPSAPSTHVYAASVGDAKVSVSDDRAELIVDHLPQPGAGRIYEVWVKRGSAAPRPARALFGVDTSGRATVVVPDSVRGVTAVLVTAEPTGGTNAPTTRPVIVTSLT